MCPGKELHAFAPQTSCRASKIMIRGSKPMVPFWGRCTTHLFYFSGWIGMFTGGTIWILTHGQMRVCLPHVFCSLFVSLREPLMSTACEVHPTHFGRAGLEVRHGEPERRRAARKAPGTPPKPKKTGRLKRYMLHLFAHLKHMAFATIKGNHH